MRRKSGNSDVRRRNTSTDSKNDVVYPGCAFPDLAKSCSRLMQRMLCHSKSANGGRGLEIGVVVYFLNEGRFSECVEIGPDETSR